MVVPDTIEPLLGFRVWAVVEESGRHRLSSLVYPALWQPEQPFASVCRRRLAALPWARPPLHDAPGFDCLCGVYATRTVARALGYLRLGSGRVTSERWRCAGAVAIWGARR